VGKRIFISTGEVSGDMQGSYLVRALLAQQPDLEIVALGGERMEKAGARLLANTSGIGSIGPVEALPLVIPTLRIQAMAKRYLHENPPDLVIYIDYMAPNISLGGYVRKHFKEVPTVYYIAPQEWVWRSDPTNTKRIIDISDLLLAVFPSEATYFQGYGGNVEWVGHPLIDIVQQTEAPEQVRARLGVQAGEPVILLTPASRTQEMKYILPDLFRGMALLKERFGKIHYWLPVANEKFKDTFIQEAALNKLDITFLPSRSYDYLAAADLVVGKSGTANLEQALLNVPQIVLYRLSNATYWFMKYVIHLNIPFASPVNLVTMESIVPEFLQKGTDPENIANQSYDLLTNDARRTEMRTGYARMRRSLGEPGVLNRAATHILKLL